MLEIVGTFLGIKHWDKRADCAVEGPNSPRGNLAQERLEFAVRQLDGIEVGRVLRQVSNRCPRLRNRLPNAGPLVGFEIVHDDDVIAPERREEALFDIGEEHVPGHCAFHHHGCGHLVVAQSGHEGDGLPSSMRRAADRPHAARSAPAQPHHVGADRGLVDKHQSGGIKQALRPHPASAGAGHIGALPLAGLQAFF